VGKVRCASSDNASRFLLILESFRVRSGGKKRKGRGEDVSPPIGRHLPARIQLSEHSVLHQRSTLDGERRKRGMWPAASTRVVLLFSTPPPARDSVSQEEGEEERKGKDQPLCRSSKRFRPCR